MLSYRIKYLDLKDEYCNFVKETDFQFIGVSVFHISCSIYHV